MSSQTPVPLPDAAGAAARADRRGRADRGARRRSPHPARDADQQLARLGARVVLALILGGLLIAAADAEVQAAAELLLRAARRPDLRGVDRRLRGLRRAVRRGDLRPAGRDVRPRDPPAHRDADRRDAADPRRSRPGHRLPRRACSTSAPRARSSSAAIFAGYIGFTFDLPVRRCTCCSASSAPRSVARCGRASPACSRPAPARTRSSSRSCSTTSRSTWSRTC